MTLLDTFNVAIRDAEHLRLLYRTILTTNTRAIRPEWANRFYRAQLTTWPKLQGLWRSSNASVLIVGTNPVAVSHTSFQHEALAVLLRSSLVLYMAAVDKILHEALSKHFAKLARNESLDKLVEISVSKAYQIAQQARIRTGKGGKKKKRPGHALKAEMLADIYKDTYLATHRLEQVCAACGKNQIFRSFLKVHPGASVEETRNRWSKLYVHRNRIAHECDIIRKAKIRRAKFHPVNSAAIQAEMDFVIQFGRFLAQQLE